MEILNPTEASLMVEDDLLNFTLEGEEEELKPTFNLKGHFSSSQSTNPSTTISRTETQNASLPEFVEEDLEWLSNMDAFPSVETCFGILSDNPELMLNRESPVSVLESSSSSINSNSNSNSNGSTVASWCGSFKFPGNNLGRARSKRQRKRAGFGEFPSQQCLWLNEIKVEKKKQESFSLQPSLVMIKNGAGMGRRCLHCRADKTPQWRAGPMGPKTLCNACGVRYKSGRLLPEYRPASSPTFSNTLHSNSHRKVIEMRRQKQIGPPDGIVANETCEYKVNIFGDCGDGKLKNPGRV
ncbi:GATA transcription factor 1-like [Olea europaea subsp. europaea]|uniref:GATA transcription factor 1-like n=1 Tax=Olea europaea subsp. europaea TaxID=158383 RepID=A0A8S0TJN3_OLEEU|nr:GATA transcription factor 1-like [Olea europaea subsp. europaea]